MSSKSGKVEALLAALGVYLVGVPIVIAGATWGRAKMSPSTGSHSPSRVASRARLVDTLTLWDGQWYLQIAMNGYDYQPGHRSSPAFFPAYPVLIQAVSTCTRLPPAWAALLVSHGFLVAAYWLLFAYMRLRFPVGAAGLRNYALLSLALFPPTFFMRMAYTESLFLFVTILAMYGMARQWPLWAIASVVGLATATRFAGVALLLPLGIHIGAIPLR